jgi:hypothetical protein
VEGWMDGGDEQEQTADIYIYRERFEEELRRWREV